MRGQEQRQLSREQATGKKVQKLESSGTNKMREREETNVHDSFKQPDEESKTALLRYTFFLSNEELSVLVGRDKM